MPICPRCGCQFVYEPSRVELPNAIATPVCACIFCGNRVSLDRVYASVRGENAPAFVL